VGCAGEFERSVFAIEKPFTPASQFAKRVPVAALRDLLFPQQRAGSGHSFAGLLVGAGFSALKRGRWDYRSGSCLSQRQIEGSLVIGHCCHFLNRPLMVTDGAPLG